MPERSRAGTADGNDAGNIASTDGSANEPGPARPRLRVRPLRHSPLFATGRARRPLDRRHDAAAMRLVDYARVPLDHPPSLNHR
jgi:hypothetical protein